jgi:hypothetical protein
MGFPVTTATALGAGVPLLDVAGHNLGHGHAGNTICVPNMGLVVAAALASVAKLGPAPPSPGSLEAKSLDPYNGYVMYQKSKKLVKAKSPGSFDFSSEFPLSDFGGVDAARKAALEWCRGVVQCEVINDGNLRTVAVIREELTKRSLSLKGTKPELQRRLLEDDAARLKEDLKLRRLRSDFPSASVDVTESMMSDIQPDVAEDPTKYPIHLANDVINEFMQFAKPKKLEACMAMLLGKAAKHKNHPIILISAIYVPKKSGDGLSVPGSSTRLD